MKPPVARAAAPAQQLALSMQLPDRASFASYFPGTNQVALAGLQQLAAGARRDVLWLAGPSGSGKTHLLQAVVRACGSAGAGYVPLGMANAGPAVLEGWQGLRCLCLDDVPAVLGQPGWERALFRVYREAEEQGISLVLAGTEPPSLARAALADLASRLAAATVFVLQPLDEAGQRAALQLRAQLRGLELPEETLLYLQRRLPRDMGTLYRLLDTLDAAALQAQRRLTVPFIRAVLEQQGLARGGG